MSTLGTLSSCSVVMDPRKEDLRGCQSILCFVGIISRSRVQFSNLELPSYSGPSINHRRVTPSPTK